MENRWKICNQLVFFNFKHKSDLNYASQITTTWNKLVAEHFDNQPALSELYLGLNIDAKLIRIGLMFHHKHSTYFQKTLPEVNKLEKLDNVTKCI